MRIKSFRFYIIKKFLKTEDIRILDIGSGSHSPSLTKACFPKSVYHSIDINEKYNNNEDDIKLIDKFFEKDLNKLEFDDIEDNYYNLLIMSHVIEHLINGDKVIESLLAKLKPNGIIYLEYPSVKSLFLPTMRETLNFFDDPTHVRIYTLHELLNLLLKNNTTILKYGTRRRLLSILLIPIKVPYQLITKSYLRAGTFWDITGFAQFIIAKRK